MEQLPLKITKNNLVLKQVKRTQNYAMYSVHFPRTEELCGYEVWKIRIQKPRTVTREGNTFEFKEKELVPCNEAFGTWGWSWATFEQAEKQYQEFLKKEQDNDKNFHSST